MKLIKRAATWGVFAALVVGAGCTMDDSVPQSADASPITQLDDTHFRVEHALWTALPELAETADSLRVVPTFVAGEAYGAKLLAIRPGSLPERFGFENGDVVRTIGGQQVFSVEDAFAAYYVAIDQKEIAVVLLRAGIERTLTFHIE